MWVKEFVPNSDAELISKVPAPTIRSQIRCSNLTSLIASSGISIERFAMKPCRWITRSLVTAKFDVSQSISLRSGIQHEDHDEQDPARSTPRSRT